mgnify:FL=1
MSQRALAIKAKMPQRTVGEYEKLDVPRELSIYKVERLLDALGYDLDAIWRKDD